MSTTILDSDWADYTHKKEYDAEIFCSEEPWEFNYLIRKIMSHTSASELQVRAAITISSIFIPPPRRRDVFVKAVISQL